MTPNQFLKYVEKELTKHKFKLLMVDKKSVFVEGHVKVSGYFDSEKMILAVTVDKPTKQWLPVLVHEFAHFTQWKSNCKAWKNTFVKGEDVSDTIFLWVKDEIKLPLDIVKIHTARSRDMELDCEKRAVRLIRKFDLPIDIPTYIKQANAYLYFYNYACLRKRWWKRGKTPYQTKAIWSEFPDTFRRSYRSLPDKYIELFDTYC